MKVGNGMKDKKRWTFSKHLVLSACITAISCICEIIILTVTGIRMLPNWLNASFLTDNIKDAASIGIIGSADGPTSIIVGGGMEFFIVLTHQLLFFILLLILYKPLKYYFKRLFSVEDSSEGKQ